MVLPPSEVQGEELLRSVAHFQREMLRRREEQERRLLLGTALEPKSPEEKGGQGRGSRGGPSRAAPASCLSRLLSCAGSVAEQPPADLHWFAWITRTTHTQSYCGVETPSGLA